MIVSVSWQFHIVPDGMTDVSDEAEAIMSSLLDLESVDTRLSDSAVGADLASMKLDVEVTVEGMDYQDCLNHALLSIRTAIHAAGGATPGWPGSDPGRARFEPNDLHVARA